MPDAPDAADEPSDEVYRIYGKVMHTVQYWELVLTLRWWRMLTPPRNDREAESQAAAKAVNRLETAFTKVTASQARKELEEDLPEELLAVVGPLIEDRNRLAHRFLREQQSGADFRPGTLAWLGDAGAQFDASIPALVEDLAARGPYEGAVRPHWAALGDTVVERLFTGEPADYQEALRRVPNDTGRG